MIKIENFEVAGLTGSMPAIRGMRNPKRSHDKMDSYMEDCGLDSYTIHIGENDNDLMCRLIQAGDTHAKWARFVHIYVDITAPLYWWKEFDTYRFGVEKNSDSTVVNIEKKQFEFADFSCEHLSYTSRAILNTTIAGLNYWRALYLNGGTHEEPFTEYVAEMLDLYGVSYTVVDDYFIIDFQPKNKFCWWQMIQLLPSTYNQKRTVCMSLQAICHMYHDRLHHKLDEWREFCAYVSESFLGKYIRIAER